MRIAPEIAFGFATDNSHDAAIEAIPRAQYH
jgi:hypothetical protein